MEYMSVQEAAGKWGVSVRRVQAYIKEGRIDGASRFGSHTWMIPINSRKPSDPRKKHISTKETLTEDFAHLAEVTLSLMPLDNPDAILESISEDRFKRPFEGELAYLRGDFETVIKSYKKIKNDYASRLRTSSVTIAAAISTGNYDLYEEIESFLKDLVESNISDSVTAIAELALNTAYTSALAPKMVTDWLKNGDFSMVPPKALPDAIYKRVKYYQCMEKYEPMLVAAQTAIEFCTTKDTISFSEIYLRLSCATASCAMGNTKETERLLTEAMSICFPHGFITPFVESATIFGGVLEKCILRDFPEWYDAVTLQWEHTFSNWISFHNKFTQNNFTSMLSLKKYEIATMLVHNIPLEEIAEKFNITKARATAIIKEIYAELLITNKSQLKKLIL